MQPVNRIIPEGSKPVAIVGTTAAGKSALAMALARRHHEVELVSVDSMQVYRGMDIGTAKPTPAEQAEVRHHGIDVVDPWEPFEVHSFQQVVADALADIAARGKRGILVGGTGLYLQAVIDGFEFPGRFPEVAADVESEPDTEALHQRLMKLDPVAAARMEPSNRRRVVRALEVTIGSGRPFSSFGPGVDAHPLTPVRLLGLRHPPDVVAERIAQRYQQQLAAGFLDEVRRLAAGPPLSRTASQALGYRELLAHLRATESSRWSLPDDQPAVDPVGTVAGDLPGGRGVDGGSDGGVRAGDVPAAEASLPWAGTLDATINEAVRRTRHFARRQRSWFRRDPRITWLDATVEPVTLVEAADEIVVGHWS